MSPIPPDPRDLTAALGRRLSREELELRHRELMLQVELVTLEEETLLASLIRHHGRRAVLAEGLTAEGVKQFQQMTDMLRKQDQELNELLKARADLKTPNTAIDRELNKLLAEHRRKLLEYGAAGQLAIDRTAVVLPLDDEQLLQAAKPVQPDGSVRLDPANLQARHDPQVMAALASGPVAVIVLGVGHDLCESVRRLGGGAVEYVRVTMAVVKQFAGNDHP